MDQRGVAIAVAERTGLSREESADTTRAVLEGLADQLSEGEARRLTAEFPGLADRLKPVGRRTREASPVDISDFIRSLSERTGLTDAEAGRGAGAVLAVLRQNLTDADYGHLVGQLPAGYAGLADSAG